MNSIIITVLIMGVTVVISNVLLTVADLLTDLERFS